LEAVKNVGLFLDISFMQKFNEEEGGSAEFGYSLSQESYPCWREKIDLI